MKGNGIVLYTYIRSYKTSNTLATCNNNLMHNKQLCSTPTLTAVISHNFQTLCTCIHISLTALVQEM